MESKQQSQTIQKPQLRIKKLDPKAFIPTKGSDHAAGYDLYSIEDLVVPKGQKKLVSTGIAMQIPIGNYGRIAPRSGLAAKNFIDIGAGVIDADYRGEVKVNVGDRIAQLIVEKYTRTEIYEVPDGEELESSVRGAGGFGSTGVKLQDDKVDAEEQKNGKRKPKDQPIKSP